MGPSTLGRRIEKMWIAYPRPATTEQPEHALSRDTGLSFFGPPGRTAHEFTGPFDPERAGASIRQDLNGLPLTALSAATAALRHASGLERSSIKSRSVGMTEPCGRCGCMSTAGGWQPGPVLCWPDLASPVCGGFEFGIALILLGTAALGYLVGLARSKVLDAELTERIDRQLEELREEQRRVLEEKRLSDGVSPIEQSWRALAQRAGAPDEDPPAARVPADDIDRRLADLIRQRCDRVWTGIKEKRYWRQVDGKTVGPDLGCDREGDRGSRAGGRRVVSPGPGRSRHAGAIGRHPADGSLGPRGAVGPAPAAPGVPGRAPADRTLPTGRRSSRAEPGDGQDQTGADPASP